MLCFENVNLSAITFLIYEFGKSIYSPAAAGNDGAEVKADAPLALPDAIASSISAFIILPPGPEPVILVISTP